MGDTKFYDFIINTKKNSRMPTAWLFVLIRNFDK